MKTKVFTLYIIHKNHKILLGYKKRGLGAHKYNGFGGKLNPPESISCCALRELLEECNIRPIDGRFLALLVFNIFGEKWFVHLFKAQEFQGEVQESEEMRPEWFEEGEIPFGNMWKDDEIWFPKMLEGQCFLAEFHFQDEETITKYEMKDLSFQELIKIQEELVQIKL